MHTFANFSPGRILAKSWWYKLLSNSVDDPKPSLIIVITAPLPSPQHIWHYSFAMGVPSQCHFRRPRYSPWGNLILLCNGHIYKHIYVLFENVVYRLEWVCEDIMSSVFAVRDVISMSCVCWCECMPWREGDRERERECVCVCVLNDEPTAIDRREM